MHSTKTYLEMAKEAIAQVKDIRSANTLGAKITDSLGLTSYGKAVSATQAKQNLRFYGDPPYAGRAYAQKVLTSKAGNCSDKTEVAFQYLIENYGGCISLTKCSSEGYDHAFMIIHRGANLKVIRGNSYDRNVFGMNAVLVDAWMHDYYKLNGSPTISISAWMVTPQQLKTRYFISQHSLHVLVNAETV